VVGEASDGEEAVQKAQNLHPDLILLDIGLPTINGIEVARRVLQYAPNTKILFASEEQSPDIIEEALGTGACGYVVKSNAAAELLPAVDAVLQGKQFVSSSLTTSAFGDPEKDRTAHHRHRHEVAHTPLSNVVTRRHEVGFYSDDQWLLDDVTQFLDAALMAGNAAVVIATESHRTSLLLRLQAQGINISVAIAEGRFIALDATDVLSTFMVDDTLDPVRFTEAFSSLIATSAKAATGEHPRVALFGEGTHLLWTQGHIRAAIQNERLCTELTKIYDVDILCGYSVGSVQGGMDPHLFQQICGQHSAVHSR
jgi:CheY-like chemotaxis protein